MKTKRACLANIIIILTSGIALISINPQKCWSTVNVPALQIIGTTSSFKNELGSDVIIHALVKDEDGTPVESALVTAYIEPMTIVLTDEGGGHYANVLDTGNLEVTGAVYAITINGKKNGYMSGQTEIKLEVKQQKTIGIPFALTVFVFMILMPILTLATLSRKRKERGFSEYS